MRALRVWAILFLAAALPAQPAETKDPLGRSTPQDSVFQFLQACHARDYRKALHYLDLRGMPPDQRAKQGPILAQQLEDLLDDTPFDITTLSRDPEGDQFDSLSPAREHLYTVKVNGQNVELQLERVELKPGYHVWLVAADSVALIPQAHARVTESGFEKLLPPPLVSVELFDTPIWRWIALMAGAVLLWILTRAVAWAIVRVLRPLLNVSAFRGPVRLCLTAAALRVIVELAPPAVLARLYVDRALGLAFSLGLAWAAAALIDLVAKRWYANLDPRVQAVSYSVLPLGRQIFKLTLFLIAVLSVLGAWGYNTSTILAGLGVGGLAIALAAQKTIENLFGGISVIGDRPVLVGDICRFGDRIGTVMHIGLRSTRIRTPERTIISVPNAQFSAQALENISGRDKIWFHPTFALRRDTSPEQMAQVLDSFRQVLAAEPKIETGAIPVRFIGIGQYSLDVEVNAYVKTSNFDEFLSIQQELLLKMLKSVENAGTALAVPLQESVGQPPKA